MDLKEEVKTISEFANIRIPADEIEKFANEFGKILAYMDKIGTIPPYEVGDTKGAEYYTPLRKDKIRIGPHRPIKPLEGKYYKVPKVI
jgi:Asp-tRNA(Asn)/Glu-tRNA(Gln) amidotransferase C subunit